ncbi:MAG: hypothetical protein E6Q43_01455, partial [Dokdonella sp.]
RKFVQALDQGDLRAAGPLALIQRLYAVEKTASEDGLDVTARQRLRDTRSRPLMTELRKQIDALCYQAPPKTPLGRAITYALRQWDTLTVFLDDGALRPGRVEHWRGGCRNRGVAVAGRFRVLRRCLIPIHRSVSSARSSNRACGFPAPGSPPMPHAFAFGGPKSVAGGL